MYICIVNQNRKKNMEENLFLKHVENSTYTENGAIAVKSTLSAFADQFGLAGNYSGRNLEDVFADMEKLWNENPTMAMRFIFYLRAVTRKTRVNEDYTTSSVVKGQGSRDEVFKRLLWVAKYHPESFYKNIPFLPVVGSWKDVWQLLFYDVNLGVNAIDHEAMFEVIKVFLKSEINLDLIKKYLPRIRCQESGLHVRVKLIGQESQTVLLKNLQSILAWVMPITII